MNPEKTFRCNFVVACVMHCVLIGGVVFWEGFVPHERAQLSTVVTLMTPADVLGVLPEGPGHGRGEFAPPPPTAEPPRGGDSGPTNFAVEEHVAPPTRPVPPPPLRAPNPREISIPKKIVKPEKTPSSSSQPRQTQTTQKPKSVAGTTAKGTSSSASTASDIRKRMEQALARSGSGTGGGSYGGDNKPKGGGSGRGPIGSPDGAVDGMPGGVGKGTQFASYYIHVHDKMYEAWEQPGDALNWDKRLMTTILIRVARDGRIEGVSLMGSSGNKLMDDSALAAARRVLMLDAPPDALVKGSTANISIDFQMEG